MVSMMPLLRRRQILELLLLMLLMLQEMHCSFLKVGSIKWIIMI